MQELVVWEQDDLWASSAVVSTETEEGVRAPVEGGREHERTHWSVAIIEERRRKRWQPKSGEEWRLCRSAMGPAAQKLLGELG